MRIKHCKLIFALHTCKHPCTLSHVRLFATPWAVAHQAPLYMESSRQEYWSRLPFLSPGDLPDPGIEPTSLCFLHWQEGTLPAEPPGKPLYLLWGALKCRKYIFCHFGKVKAMKCYKGSRIPQFHASWDTLWPWPRKDSLSIAKMSPLGTKVLLMANWKQFCSQKIQGGSLQKVCLQEAIWPPWKAIAPLNLLWLETFDNTFYGKIYRVIKKNIF